MRRAQVVVRDADDDEDDEEEDDDVERLAVGDKIISIRTSTLEEKATACQMLICYVEARVRRPPLLLRCASSASGRRPVARAEEGGASM